MRYPNPPLAHLIAPRHCCQIGGLWGRRLRDTVDRWMLHVSEDALLDGFRRRPGVQPWIGEHLGKYLDAAASAAAQVDRPELEAKMERLVTAWLACQEEDGYLGTYLPADRWQPGDPRREAQTPCWDPWVHKYAILGLLSYGEGTGHVPAVEAAQRIGHLIAREFGPFGKRDLNRTDEHAGLASGSLLEAMLVLHRSAGSRLGYEFAEHVVRDLWERPDGPGVMRGLREGAPLHTIGDGKAYEMMSCFVGLVEYCRATGDTQLCAPLLAARDRIATQLRYPTGGMSDTEWFKPPGQLREEAPLETCVSFTWMQWNLRLFELTGDRAALDLTEETAWNQILPAVCPDGSTWTYHLPPTGPKRFAHNWIQGVDGRYGGAALSCCHTNGQRALALFPRHVFSLPYEGGVAVNFYCACTAQLPVPRMGAVRICQRTDYPASGTVELDVNVPPGHRLDLALRVPAWADTVCVDGQPYAPEPTGRVWLEVEGRRCLHLEFPMAPRAVVLGGSSRGKVALARGPLVFALDADQAPAGWTLDEVALALDPRGSLDAVRTEVGPTGWPVLVVPVRRLPTSVVASAASLRGAPSGQVRLEPVLFAGLAGRPRWDRLDRDDAPWDQTGTPDLPAYRTMLPWLPD